MARKYDILQELNDNAPELASIESAMPYKVPAGYFDDLAELVLMRIQTMSAGTAGEELETLSPLLHGLKKEMPYKVPDGYFESLAPDQIKKPAPVRSISFPKRVFRYAVAAVVAGLIAATAWFTLDKPAEKNTVSLAQNDSVSPGGLTNISDAEIENYLEASISAVNFEPSNSNDIKPEDVRLMLTEISDKELENYLN
jgi:hypothetical protein